VGDGPCRVPRQKRNTNPTEIVAIAQLAAELVQQYAPGRQRSDFVEISATV